MHDIWNPWHGCNKVSEGCANCYMYFLDKKRGSEGSIIYKTKNFDYPLQKTRTGGYKIKSGELIRVCMTSDFFLKEADPWRKEAWEMMRMRPDVKFFLLTKRPERVKECLPANWGEGWENIIFNVSCENQEQADIRIPILLKLPFRHKGIMTAPLIGSIEIKDYLATGQIEQVISGGENYDGSRPCNFDWIKSLSNQCKIHNVKFTFIETGTNFIKDGKTYHIPDKKTQAQMAWKANVNNNGKEIKFILKDSLGLEISEDELYKPNYRKSCLTCGNRPICNGCSYCDRCKD